MNRRRSPRLVLLALALGGFAVAAAADSLATSSAVGGSSASSTSSASSASSDKSSDSSAQNKHTAVGPYRIVDVAAVAERPGALRLTLQPLGAQDARAAYILYVPQQAFDRSGLAVGGTVDARPRPYGTEFADAGTRKAFFLMVDDDWYRELAANPVRS